MQAPRGRYVVSGCSGGGKSTLIAELERRGVAVAHEAGREIVREERDRAGGALPWLDAGRFLERMVGRVVENYERVRDEPGPVVFDRGLLEAANGFECRGAALPSWLKDAIDRCSFEPLVFMAPPWPEIFERDAERRHGFEDALREWETLVACYERHGHDVVLLPKVSVGERADLVLERIRAV